MIKKAVILCGGLGTRFLPISKSVPKEVMPILDKPVIQILCEDLQAAGVEQALIIVGRGKEAILNHFDKNPEIEQRILNKPELLEKEHSTYNILDITYKRCPEPNGTAGALRLAEKFVGKDPFIMMFGDEVMFNNPSTPAQLIKAYKKYRNNVIAVQQVDKKEVYKYGIIRPSIISKGYYQVLDMVEKPKVGKAPSNISYIGGAVLKSEIFDAIEKIKPSANGEYVLTDAYIDLIKEGKLFAQEIEGNRIDVGNKLGLIKANVEAGLLDESISIELKKYIMSLLEKI